MGRSKQGDAGGAEKDSGYAGRDETGDGAEEMSGANSSPTGRSYEEMCGANASPTGRSHEQMTAVTFQVWRGDRGEGQFVKYTTEISEGMVVLDAIHKIQAEQAN